MAPKKQEEKLKIENEVVSTTSPSAKLEEKKEETIEIKRSDFDKMMKTMEKQSKDIDLLYKTADKGRMAKELNKEGENLIKQSSVSTWGNTGRLVVGWSDLITNRCEVVMGKWYEDQTLNVIFEDGEVMTVSYLEFARSRTNKLPADVIGRIEEDGELKYKLQFPSGKILIINTKFLN